MEIFKAFSEAFSHWSAIEMFAVISAIFYLILATAGNRFCFIFGFISSAIYVYITFDVKLYFDLLINLYYVFISVYGWILWSKNKEIAHIPTQRIAKKTLVLLIITGFVCTMFLGTIAHHLSDASLPYLDAFTTTFSVIATGMIVGRYIENWLIWIIIDSIAVGMYWHKTLPLTSLLFLLYTILAVYGYFQWKKRLHA